MAANPVPWLIVVFLTSMFQAMVYGETIVATNIEGFGDEAPSGIDIVGEILGTIWQVILLLTEATFFPFRGAPFFLRAAFGAINLSIIAWSAATLIRGN